MGHHEVPTIDDLLKLPMESRVLFALRAAQRAKPIFQLAPEPARGRLQRAQEMLEQASIAQPRDLSEALLESHNIAFSEASRSHWGFAVSTLCSALYAALLAKFNPLMVVGGMLPAGESVAKGANFAAMNCLKAAHDVGADNNVLTQMHVSIWADFHLLKQMAVNQPDVKISQVLLGALWPDGLPPLPPWTEKPNESDGAE